MKNTMKAFALVLCSVVVMTSLFGCRKDTGETEGYFSQSVTTEAAASDTGTTAKVTSVTSAKTTATTTKTATSATNPSIQQNKLQYSKYYDTSMSDALFRMSQSTNLFEVTDTATWYFYHFSDKGTTGIGANGSLFHNKGYASLDAAINKNRYLTVEFASRSDDIVFTDFQIESNNNTTDTLIYSFNSQNAKFTADLYDACYKNGFYRIRAYYNFIGKAQSCDLYLYINCASDLPKDYEFYICYGEQHKYSDKFDPVARQEKITNLIASEGATSTNTLSTNIIYPYNAETYNCDTPFWINKAHDILDKYNGLSKGEQALLLHDWITENLKYDNYKVNVLKFSRYAVNGLDTSQYVSKNYTGICLDFSNIYAIMCREYGIPCVIFSTASHAWNAIYLNGEWIEVDLTQDVKRYVNGVDTNDVTGSQLYCYDGFATYNVNNVNPDTATRFGF